MRVLFRRGGWGIQREQLCENKNKEKNCVCVCVCLVSLFVSVCRSCVSSSSVPRPPITRCGVQSEAASCCSSFCIHTCT